MDIRIASNLSAVQPSMTLALTARAAELKAKGVDICSFTAGEPDFDTPEHIRRAAADAVLKGGPVCRYTAAAGMPELRKAIVAKLKRENGLDYTPDQVVVCTGAKQAIFNALAALLDPGDEVIIPAPYWVSYPEIVIALGGKPVFIDASTEPNFSPAPWLIRRALTDRTRALILCSPSNPTGGVISGAQLGDILGALEGTRVVLISDEIYEHLVYDNATHVSAASLGADAYGRTLTVNGVSKAYAMTGWRIGYAAGPTPLIKAMTTLQSHATSNAATVSQIAATAALTGDQGCVGEMRAAFDDRRKAMIARLNDISGVECAAPRGAFYAFPKVSALYGTGGVNNSTSFCQRLLDEQAVAAVPGAAFGADAYIRLSYATSMETVERGCQRIAAFAAGPR